MRETGNAQDARPYHHGDLAAPWWTPPGASSRREGPRALSLRAVAREAGVSPAAPYHHFKDKTELLEAVAKEAGSCWTRRSPRPAAAPPTRATRSPTSASPMSIRPRQPGALPADVRHAPATAGAARVTPRRTTAATPRCSAPWSKPARRPATRAELELATIASWCAAHGLAEMASFKQFEPLKEAMGGEKASCAPSCATSAPSRRASSTRRAGARERFVTRFAPSPTGFCTRATPSPR